MAKFKCKQSGNIFEFLNDHDIKTMRTHTGYEEVAEKVLQKLVDLEQIPAKRIAGTSKKT